MVLAEKMATVKTMLGLEGDMDNGLIATYLSMAEQEILSWRYGPDGPPETVTAVPYEYEIVQVHAVVVGYGIMGAEGQEKHEEVGVVRTFRYEDMVAYIRAHVVPMVRVIG